MKSTADRKLQPSAAYKALESHVAVRLVTAFGKGGRGEVAEIRRLRGGGGEGNTRVQDCKHGA